MHAELVTPPALPPRIRFPTRAIRSARPHDGPAMWRGLRSSHLLLSGRRRSRASKSSAQSCWPWRSQSTGVSGHLSPADAMIDITQVVLLSVCQELWSEYGEPDSLNFSSISSAFSHTSFLSRLRAGRQPAARPQDSYILNGCRSYYPMLGKRRAATNTTPLFRVMQAAAFTCAE